jgi:hypothetical protein
MQKLFLALPILMLLTGCKGIVTQEQMDEYYKTHPSSSIKIREEYNIHNGNHDITRYEVTYPDGTVDHVKIETK